VTGRKFHTVAQQVYNNLWTSMLAGAFCWVLSVLMHFL